MTPAFRPRYPCGIVSGIPTSNCGEDETHKAEYLDAIDGLATGWLFNLLLSRINFDGMDPRTFSLAELHGAIAGAEWPATSKTLFYGAQCPSYPNCRGGCGLGCTKEHEPEPRTAAGSLD